MDIVTGNLPSAQKDKVMRSKKTLKHRAIILAGGELRYWNLSL
jgi:hypothetical protein